MKRKQGSKIFFSVELIQRMMKALANIVKHDVTKISAFLHIFRVIYIDLIREKKIQTMKQI